MTDDGIIRKVKEKPTLGTKRQYYDDSAQDKKAKKQVLDNTSNFPHLVTPMSETPTNCSTQKSLVREPIFQTTTVPFDSLELVPNDPSFLKRILAGVKPAQLNLNTYTQVAL